MKIGFTESETVLARFTSFKMYSPLGAVIEAVIETTSARKLEGELHKKYELKRVSGEFFQMTSDEVKAIREQYENEEQMDLRNAVELFISRSTPAEIKRMKNMIGKQFSNIGLSNKNDFIEELVKNALNQKFVGRKFTASNVSDYLMDTMDDIEKLPSLKEIGHVLKSHCDKKSVRIGQEVKKMYYMNAPIE